MLMYNTDMPGRAELPTTHQLIRSTLIALVTAAALLVTVVLPAEYAVDPTGAGRLLGLTQMGEIKQQLAEEAEADAAVNVETANFDAPLTEETGAPQVAETSASTATPQEPAAAWRDEVSLFQAAVRAQPASVQAHALLGAALMEAGRAEEGVKELEVAYRAQAALPVPNPAAGIELGVAYERTGRLAEAEAVYAEVLRSVPEQPDALWRLGVVRWSQGSRAEAVRLWERTLAVAPDHARAMSDLGIAAYADGDAAKAERLWLAATRADPRAAGPWLSLGALYEARGDVQRARDAWRRFLELARYGAYPGQREQVAERLRALDAGSLPARRP
jgi:tetratricopeptide (TPR) repeat protein